MQESVIMAVEMDDAWVASDGAAGSRAYEGH